jgi:sugar lactone lactonase YvrE
LNLRCVVQALDRLGEGPVWSALEGRLWWFDIKGRRLSWYAPACDETGRFELPVRASAAAPRAGGGLIAATEAGLAAFDSVSGEFDVVQPHAFESGFRSNDGKIDPAGAFWWSTMDDNGGARPGAVYRTRPDWTTERVLDGIHIVNALAWSPDGGRLYLADSKLDTIFTSPAAEPQARQVFARGGGEAGSPDGAAMDADGFLWVAHWGGWRIVRYAPDGRVDRIVPVPVQQPTSCAFGGEDLSTLFVTSAWDELSDAERAAQPLAGGLFALEPGVKGQPLPLFEG